MGGLTIAVVMSTCMREGEVGDLRASYAEQAIASLVHLWYSGPMRLHFADDGSREGMREQLVEWGRRSSSWTHVTTSNVEGEGFGRSMNLAREFLDSDLLFYLPDDWILEDELDLTIPAKLLADPSIGMVRTGMVHPNLTARSVYGGPELQYYWLIDKAASGYAMSFRTWLTHRRFWDCYGPLPEDRDIYATERVYNQHVRATEGPDIVYAGNVGLNWPWKHIGDRAVGGEEA